MRRDNIPDFCSIEPRHMAIHLRLENWGRWANSRAHYPVQPMFRLYRSDEHWEGASMSAMVDQLDAQHIQKAVVQIPENHRHSLNWFYIFSGPPAKIARKLGVSTRGLADILHEARIMVTNRVKPVDRPRVQEYKFANCL